MFAGAKRKQHKQVRQLQCQEQCIDHIPYYLSGLSRAQFVRQPFPKQLYKWSAAVSGERVKLYTLQSPLVFFFLRAFFSRVLLSERLEQASKVEKFTEAYRKIYYLLLVYSIFNNIKHEVLNELCISTNRHTQVNTLQIQCSETSPFLIFPSFRIYVKRIENVKVGEGGRGQ